MNDTVLKVALAGLLHDIGKFMQRAELPLSNASKGLESSICKLNMGHYSHRHVLWTNDFFEIFAGHIHLGVDYEQDSIANLAAYHHNPATRLQEIIQLADCLSSGSERQEDEYTASGRDNYKKVRLHSIFDYLQLDEKLNKDKIFRYELRPLDDSLESSFPIALTNLQPAEGEKLVENYGRLWDAFRNDFEKIDLKEKSSFITSLLSLLEKYTWCIPSSTMNRPDISLFDHSKTTAAIATALHIYHVQKGDITTASLTRHDKTNKFRLLVGDLSGIQNYIYNIKNVGVGGTAKRLRARSFYLSALAEVASHALLHAFNLPLTNLVIASGGKFYLMLPNTVDAEKIINEYKSNFSKWLIKNLNGEIALNIADVTFSCHDLLEFNIVLKRVNDALQIAKERSFSNYLMDAEGWKLETFLLSDRQYKEEEALCTSCKKFPGTHKKEEDILLCSHCSADIDLGADLARAVGVQFFSSHEGGRYPIFENYSFSVVKDKKDYSTRAYLVQQFNNWEFDAANVALKPRPFANHIPLFNQTLCEACKKETCPDSGEVKAGNPKFFTCLATISRGRKMLGVFKADVDNLGLIFINGFAREEEKCISRIITLSRLLESFFTGRLDHLLKTEFVDIYTGYAGGDDLLMLGPWDQVLRFSFRVREEFRRFTCRNPAFTMSAGLGLMHPRLPVYTAVADADELLDKAKNEKAVKTGMPKDQLAVFDDVIKWDVLVTVQKEADRLAAWQDEKKVSMGFVRHLLSSAEDYRRYKNENETKYLRFVPMLAYSIARNIPARESELVKWSQDLTDLSSKNLQHLAYITNYSIQTNRS